MMNSSPEDIDDTLDVLSNRHRRRTLEYISEVPNDWTSITDLEEHLVSLENGDGNATKAGRIDTTEPTQPCISRETKQSLETKLHHVHLPKLESSGLVDYDARSGAIRYDSDEYVEELLTLLQETA